MNLFKFSFISLFAIMLSGLNAQAGVVEVFAQANSSTGGAGAVTGTTVNIGDRLVMVTDVTDCWSAGPTPRDSNADGLVGAAGTCQPTALFSNWTQGGLSAPYGSLVGKIGGGAFFLVGTFFDQIMASAGALTLYYWDSNSGDNSGSVRVSISVNSRQGVPEPGVLGILSLGLGLLLFRRRLRN